MCGVKWSRALYNSVGEWDKLIRSPMSTVPRHDNRCYGILCICAHVRARVVMPAKLGMKSLSGQSDVQLDLKNPNFPSRFRVSPRGISYLLWISQQPIKRSAFKHQPRLIKSSSHVSWRKCDISCTQKSMQHNIIQYEQPRFQLFVLIPRHKTRYGWKCLTGIVGLRSNKLLTLGMCVCVHNWSVCQIIR